MECLPNRLTLLYSEIYYKEENHLKVRTAVFKYINSSIVKVEYVGMSVCLVRKYVSTFGTYMTMWLGYPLFYGSTGSISSVSCALILNQYKSPFSTCTILFIRSVTKQVTKNVLVSEIYSIVGGVDIAIIINITFKIIID